MKDKRTLVAVAASIAVAALVIAGLFAVGSPATARKFEFDQRRVEQLAGLHRALVRHFADEGELPANLNDLNPALFEEYGGAADPRRDPETGEPFEYRRLSERQYEVCARFHTSSDDPRNPNRSFRGYRPAPLEFVYGGFVEHKPGRNCFQRTLTNSEIRDLFPERVPVPEAPRIPEAVVSPVTPAVPEAPPNS